jgi:hypothetical protein
MENEIPSLKIIINKTKPKKKLKEEIKERIIWKK